MRTADWTTSVSVLDRVTAVFEAFHDDDEGLGVTELARRANLPKSTVSRIAADLVAEQFLDREGNKLFLGVRLFELGHTVEQPRRLRQAALPAMTELRSVTGLTATLGILEGADVVIVAVLRVDDAAERPARVGTRLPAHTTALGKAILGFSSRAAAQRIVDRGLTRRTPRTITDPAKLLGELVEIRRGGIAIEREECVIERVGVAAPVLAHDTDPVAAIAVTGTSETLLPERVGSAVRAAAITLGHRLGAGHQV